MRDLNECKNEVFYRSSARIRERRQKRKKIMLCSLCLCLTVLGMTAMSDMQRKTKDEGEELLEGGYLYQGDGSVDKENAGETEASQGVMFSSKDEAVPEAESAPKVNYQVQYIRTDGSHEKIEHIVIRSVEELKNYYERNKDKHNLERREHVNSDTTIGFLDACDKYDTEFFKENSLIMILLGENSGSIRHKVNSVERTNGCLLIGIQSISPEVGTCDMAGWHIIVEVDKHMVPENKEKVFIFYNGKMMMDKD